MGTFSKFAKVAHVHFSSWKQSIVSVSASWPHAIDTPTSHWHGVSSEECLGQGWSGWTGQPAARISIQQKIFGTTWRDKSGRTIHHLLHCQLFWVCSSKSGWPSPRHSSDDTPCQWDVGVDCMGSGGGYTHYWLFSWTEMNTCDFCEFQKRTHCHKSVNKPRTRNQNVLKFCVHGAEC